MVDSKSKIEKQRKNSISNFPKFKMKTNSSFITNKSHKRHDCCISDICQAKSFKVSELNQMHMSVLRKQKGLRSLASLPSALKTFHFIWKFQEVCKRGHICNEGYLLIQK